MQIGFKSTARKSLFGVKDGGVNRSDIATLLGDVEKQKAAGEF
ncbi:MAG TPA: hypothetical protein VGQ70_01115 [Candidatus Udaeobacter sp.]|jgi:hypothetical protein|nr:hypothetical protein [Candidatus Udaeobacter sp.]